MADDRKEAITIRNDAFVKGFVIYSSVGEFKRLFGHDYAGKLNERFVVLLCEGAKRPQKER